MAAIYSYRAGMSNGFFVKDKGVIAIDTGTVEGSSTVLEQCRQFGIDPKSIKLIVITHGHVDHFFNVPAMKKVTGAQVLCHTEATPFLREGRHPDVVARTKLGEQILARQAEDGPPLDHVPCCEPDIVIDAPYDLHPWGIPGSIIHTPGHSKGCISIILDSGEAFVGDLYAEPADGSGPSGPAYFTYPGKHSDEVPVSISRLLALGVHTFYSGHGGPFTKQEIEKRLSQQQVNLSSS